jgi:hypothetical protein
MDHGRWSFEFTVEAEGIYQNEQDVFGILKTDCNGVPMIMGLDDEYALSPVLVTEGNQQNIWFVDIMVNN